MPPPQERQLVGLDALAQVTTLLQRIRGAHPTAGLYEAADLQWWWADAAATTDTLPQLFWFDAGGGPVAAVIATDWGDRIALDPIVMPGASPDWITHVMTRGLHHADRLGFDAVGLEVDPADDALRAVLTTEGFVTTGDGVVEAWLAADARPDVSRRPDGYRLTSRRDHGDRPHHMHSRRRRQPDVEQRLRQTSLYRPDLDLVMYDGDDQVAAYGLFWFDPVTSTGLVEPMRTDDLHQRRGLARHVLTSGIDLLAAAGAERIKICYESANPASSGLYLSVGFEPVRHTVVFARAGQPA